MQSADQLGITMPTFTPLGGGLSSHDLGAPENSLFGSSSLDDTATHFVDLGNSMQSSILGGSLAPSHSAQDDRRNVKTASNDLEGDEDLKDYSHLLSVFNVYKNKQNFNQSGFFNGGLDTGIEPSLLAVEFDTKE